MLRSVAVFCGSSYGNRPEYAQAARELGSALALRAITLVYGGAKVGLMGLLADECLAAGGAVIGVIPKSMVEREIAHESLTELHVVTSMHERKAMMADLASAFIAMPGGMGTFEEFLEVLTWSQLGLHQKACGLLNVLGYYDPLLTMADRAVTDGFLRPAYREMLLAASDIARLIDALAEYEPPQVTKWIDRATR